MTERRAEQAEETHARARNAILQDSLWSYDSPPHFGRCQGYQPAPHILYVSECRLRAARCYIV